jgi:hypothetical protein
VTWLAATGVLAAMLFLGFRGTARFPEARYALHAAYVAILLWHLARSGPRWEGLPEGPLFRLGERWFGRVAAVSSMLLVAGMVAFVEGAFGLLLLLLVLAAAGALTVWRRQVTFRSVVLGVAASALAFAAGGITFWRHGFVARPMLIAMLVLVPPMFVAGGMLAARTGVGGVRVIEARWLEALRSFLWGCVLFVPLGLVNAVARASDAHPPWVNQWWQPLALPLWSGIVEEVLFRLMLVCGCVALLRPALRRHPAAALVAAVLFSGAVFGLGHGRTAGQLLLTGMGYGVPMAIVFVRRDWEHAVGAHYIVNMAPWLLALLRT